jgi:hypothetical protein
MRIRLNWVLVIAGLIPLWAALFIIFTNMRVLKDDAPLMEPEPVQPIMQQEAQPQSSLELELAEEPRKEDAEEKKSLFAGLFDRFKKKDSDEQQLEEEINFVEPSSEESSLSLGIPRGLRRLWGAALILVFVACLVYGSQQTLSYLFKEYRWVIGTTNPWTSQLEMASVATKAIAGIAVMFATLKTGLHLIKN